jgi:hypothetical protein
MKYPHLRRAIESRGLQLVLVRAELYRLLRKQENVRQYHAAACPCGVCGRLRAEMQGIRDAIRHFGGKPR